MKTTRLGEACRLEAVPNHEGCHRHVELGAEGLGARPGKGNPPAKASPAPDSHQFPLPQFGFLERYQGKVLAHLLPTRRDYANRLARQEDANKAERLWTMSFDYGAWRP
jgi:hypothetical protein